jgi:SM-20-related protein
LFEELRRACNRTLTLGLFEFECHYALYPPGASYSRHRDRFRDDDARVLSCVLYLNEDWRSGDGGALRLHLDHKDPLDIAPVGGTLVAFLSGAFDHEVLPARRARIALAGWFRRRAAQGIPVGRVFARHDVAQG